ncbi:thrombospondin-2-like isoform X2 [Hydra vulgaris]|uniref:Thrombospondin-2-like isoform X2 n=1 Tax=Hydra vulgaris TaxID=6087 RepID=A0ABM4DMY3_HYDVU
MKQLVKQHTFWISLMLKLTMLLQDAQGNIDIDECASMTNYCNFTNSDCVNTNGSYNCICKSGWQLNNNSCFGEWSTWSECSKTCGLGYKYSILNSLLKSQQEAKRSLPFNGNWSNWTTNESCSSSFCSCSVSMERYCNNPVPANGGHDCFGINVRYLQNNKICQVNGRWTEWSSWSLCSQPCQGGVKTRFRSCTNPVPKYGGLPCNGSNTNETTCSLDKCKNVTVNFGIIFTDEDYEEYKPLEDKIKTAIQKLYEKFNKTVRFDLKLNSIKNVKSDQTNP